MVQQSGELLKFLLRSKYSFLQAWVIQSIPIATSIRRIQDERPPQLVVSSQGFGITNDPDTMPVKPSELHISLYTHNKPGILEKFLTTLRKFRAKGNPSWWLIER